ncbi:prolyl 3-hydroxylase sudestada1 [Euwallacea fornicatus]|uniref:prolyl 3-hydroxylase sudestada1 n=1 Tax=Euwallacea fornicatus TaxID=995702 RepID=UPI00338DB527
MMDHEEDGNEQKGSESEECFEDEEAITYLEESSESETEPEGNLWDVDCKILSLPSVTNGLIGCHLMPTCENDQDLHPKKKLKLQPSLREDLLSKPSINALQNNWKSNNSFVGQSLEIISSPFKVCIVKDLLDNTSFLNELREKFYNEVSFRMRSLDLYEFFQSTDLKHLVDLAEPIRAIYEFLKNDLMTWVSTITGYELTHISASCSLYTDSDYLLVHDDLREDRMVAFILYLTDEYGWKESDGGSLQLFSKDENGQPCDVVRSIIPVNNQLIFFPVTNESYHQVAEVTSLNKYRLSINGWFHTKAPPVFEVPRHVPLNDSLYSNKYKQSKKVNVDLEVWVRDEYLDNKAIKLIQNHIEENSEISLKSFFIDEPFKEVSCTLQEDNNLIWRKVAPINRYNYEVMDLTKLPFVIERFLDLFQSNQMFQLLRKYTELDLHKKKACMKFELQRWTPGSYALLTDYDWKERNELDLIIHLGCKKNSDVIGARTQYVTIEDQIQNALITIEPEENNLNIVYRDSARFTKYFSKQSKCKCFYTLICSYSEN